MDNGVQVSIIGDTLANIQLSFPNSSAFTIDSGHGFGAITNFSLMGGFSGYAFYATGAGSIQNLSNVNVSGFNAQLYADSAGSITCGTGIDLQNCTNFGCYADGGSIVIASRGLTFVGDYELGAGLYSINNGRIIAEEANVSNTGACVSANSGGTVDAEIFNWQQLHLRLSCHLRRNDPNRRRHPF